MNNRYRGFMLELYPDNDKHNEILSNIESYYNYALILHDKDLKESGEVKKPHYHVVIYLKSAKTITALSDELDLAEQYIEPSKKNYHYALRYLIHYDDKDKYQYSIDEVRGTLKSTLENIITNDTSEDGKLITIIDVIDGMGLISIRDFTIIMCQMHLYSYYRRSAFIINTIINEHNDTIQTSHNIYKDNL